MKKIPAAEHLTDEEYHLLLDVYANHNSSMEFENRKEHTLSHVVKIVRNPHEKSLIVYYENGNSWRYLEDRTWIDDFASSKD
ncbi:hypothetical protein P8881_19640 [Bacillus haynesii]|uniref:hypothetical protein n=1 Tax=Bacillus haynesii TaxID=1925021 RepID=UPI002280626C|nr:hypothetical protein [Bacillus haynesii]MCY8737549.1 hypothetical protein [Bacillus haynesii]MEC0709740.1 hypothetical protein [Bacillus haynesii]MEC0736881.1 hypothetical protein [Bacillus haynesii]